MRLEGRDWLNDVRFWDEAGEPNAGPPGGNSEYGSGNWDENGRENGVENGDGNTDGDGEEGYGGCAICEWGCGRPGLGVV